MNTYPEPDDSRLPRPVDDNPFTAMFDEFDAVVLTDRLDVETHVSQLLGAIRLVAEGVAATEAHIGREFIEYLTQRGDSGASAVLAALASLAVTPELRAAADTAVMALAVTGVAAPGWHRHPVHVTECWEGGDIFGESTTVLCIAEGGAVRHGIVALVDNDCPQSGPVLSDVFITAEPDQVAAALHEPEGAGELAMPPKQVTPARAAAILRAGLADLDDNEPVDDPESTVLHLRALLAARCREVPDSAGTDQVVPPRPSQGEINRTMNTFLSEPESAPLPRTEEVIAALELVVAFHLPGGLRVGPAITQTFLHEWIPGRLEAGDAMLPILAEVLRTFNCWAARITGLPDEAAAIVDRQTRACAKHYREDIPDHDQDIVPDWPGLFD